MTAQTTIYREIAEQLFKELQRQAADAVSRGVIKVTADHLATSLGDEHDAPDIAAEEAYPVILGELIDVFLKSTHETQFSNRLLGDIIIAFARAARRQDGVADDDEPD